jgi:hypothetical protein
MGIVQGLSGGDLGPNFCKPRKDEEFYILQIKHYQKLMPHLVMPDFQLAIVAFPTRSTFATQINEAWEVGEEMEIDSRGVVNEVGIGVEETLGS